MEERKRRKLEDARRSGGVLGGHQQHPKAEKETGRTGIRRRIQKAERAKKQAEKLRKKADKKWENSWWDNLAEEAEGAEKMVMPVEQRE